MRGFRATGLTNLALGEAVPCRQEERWPKRTSEAKEQTLLFTLPLRSKKQFNHQAISNILTFSFLEMNGPVYVAGCGPAIPTADRKIGIRPIGFRNKGTALSRQHNNTNTVFYTVPALQKTI
ncbi:hypothetical protein [Pedobacter miscanthi]|nr:hypothetical protein [Pedobacter miscanthi]